MHLLLTKGSSCVRMFNVEITSKGRLVITLFSYLFPFQELELNVNMIHIAQIMHFVNINCCACARRNIQQYQMTIGHVEVFVMIFMISIFITLHKTLRTSQFHGFINLLNEQLMAQKKSLEMTKKNKKRQTRQKRYRMSQG